MHVHEPMIPAVSLTALLAARAPLVGTFHMSAATPRWYRPFAPICRRALRRLDVRIAVSEAACRHVARTCPGEYHVVPNGVAVEAFTPSRRSGDGFRVLFIGRPEPRKGLPVLLQAFKRLPRHATLDLVGVDRDALSRSGVELSPAVATRIRTHGMVDSEERARLLAGADVLCVPSLGGESFGVVLVEGMAAGLPVVASAVAGTSTCFPRAPDGWFSPAIRPRLPAPSRSSSPTRSSVRASPARGVRQRADSTGRSSRTRS